jgi:mxaD protein
MRDLLKGLLISLFLYPTLVLAHGAPRLEVEESIVINAGTATVWDAVKNFDNAHGWIPMIAATEATGGNEKGATRTLTLREGGTIAEVLKKYDATTMSYMYQITDISKAGEVDDHGEMHEVPVFPVGKYKAWVSVEAVDGGTKLTWLAKFFRAYHGKHEPPTELNDNTAKEAVTQLFQTTLKDLKAKLEK